MAECLVHRLRSSSLKDAVITPSSSSLTVYGGTGSNTVSFTYTGDGTVSASSSNTGAATVAVSGNNITVTYVAAGSATITISAPKTSKYKECSATVSVICERSTSTLSLSATSGTIYGGGSSGAYTYSYNGDGAVSASSSNTGVATVALSGNNISVSYVAPGSVTVTVSAPQTAKYNAVSATIAITCSRTALTKPSLTQTSFSTTGNTCAPGYNNYNSSLMTVSGTTSASSPGSYAIYFNLKDTNRYCWSDGSTGQIACGWSVSAGRITFYIIRTRYSYNRGYYIQYYCTYGQRFIDVNGLTGTGHRVNEGARSGFAIRTGVNGWVYDTTEVTDNYYSASGVMTNIYWEESRSNGVSPYTTISHGAIYYANITGL